MGYSDAHLFNLNDICGRFWNFWLLLTQGAEKLEESPGFLALRALGHGEHHTVVIRALDILDSLVCQLGLLHHDSVVRVNLLTGGIT